MPNKCTVSLPFVKYFKYEEQDLLLKSQNKKPLKPLKDNCQGVSKDITHFISPITKKNVGQDEKLQLFGILCWHIPCA